MLFLQGNGREPPAPMEPAHDLPAQQGEDDCPVCYGENALAGREAVCPNGHRLCAECQPHVQSVQHWRTRTAHCPLCRASIPYVPRNAPAPVYAPEEDLLGLGGYGAEAVDTAARRLAAQQRHLREEHPQRAGGGTEERRQRAIDGFRLNGQVRREAREQFLHLREAGHIPADSMFGGIHMRKCGTRRCDRTGGHQGVRFLKTGTGKRMYRCEICYRAENNGMEPQTGPQFAELMMREE